jgi:outer membrane protein OmpA-like peptidoglycan-associated protein
LILIIKQTINYYGKFRCSTKEKGVDTTLDTPGARSSCAFILPVKGCGNDTKDAVATTTDSVTTSTTTTATGSGWDDVDHNGPVVNYDEITDKNINVRGNSNYGVYSLGESILFDEGKADIRSSAAQNLEQINASISKRYNGGEIRVFGYTDATGSAATNKELAEQRAEAVRNWLVKNGKVDEGKVSIHPVGESQPAATNATSEGRQQNRRVEIVARVAQSGQ